MSKKKRGRGRPFPKGVSGNLKGRPKGSCNLRTLLAKELSTRVPVRENGKLRYLTKRQVTVHRWVARAMEGDLAALKLILQYDPAIAEMFGEAHRSWSGPIDEEMKASFVEQLRADLVDDEPEESD